MQNAERASIRLLLVMMTGTVVLPAILFGYASWLNYRSTYATARERIERSLDVLYEHAQKIFEPVNLVFLQTAQLTSALSDENIRNNEHTFHIELKKTADALAQVEAIWMFDAAGAPIVASNYYPLPPNLSYRDQEFFSAHVQKDIGIFIGEVTTPPLATTPPTPPVFAVSRRRDASEFAGVVQVSIPPKELERFYASMGRYPGAYFAMLRADGTFLARYPGAANLSRLDARTGFHKQIAREEIGGIYVSGSINDGRERLIGTRKLADYPIYISAGIETSAIRDEWLSTIGAHLIFGIPATALMLLALAVALRRTRSAFSESERRERAEAALRQAQRIEAIGQLTGGVAHDFNNLLMVIKGSVERLMRTPRAAGDVRYFGMINIAADRGQTLTRQLLAFSRQQVLAPEVIDLSARIAGMEELLRRSLRGDIDIRIDAPPHPCRVEVDTGELELAVLNLGVNARDAMPAGGTLTIRVEVVTLDGSPEGLHGPYAALSFIDTGTGIAEDVMPRVFDPFFTTKDIGKGTGLGLSQVFGFAKQSGGTVAIKSKLGEGATIIIYLPLTAEPLAAPRAAPAGTTDWGLKGHVLVVEDNQQVAMIVRDFLEQLGFTTALSVDVQSALGKLDRGEKFDAVFSDILMPGGRNGLDLAREVRRRHPDMLVILTTGYSGSAEEAAREGYSVLRKPYGLQDIGRAFKQGMLQQA